MTNFSKLETMLQRIESRLSDLFDGHEPKSLYDPMFHPLKSGGKRIRPLLCLLSAEAVGGKTEPVYDAAVALELLHTFTLVHDDIMDHDAVRRGQPTVHVKWDEPTAILAGDGLVTLAYQSLLHTEHPRLIRVLRQFTEGLLVLCEGQALDKAFERLSQVSLEDYLLMIHKKTAKLLEVSCETGAILGGGSEEEIQSLKSFARELGIAFQIQDDLFDLISEETIFGKPQGSDLMEKKKTYLTIHFEQHADPEQLNTYHRFYKNEISTDDLPVFIQLFEETGTIEATKEVVAGGIKKAVSHLSGLKPDEPRKMLEFFALQIGSRIR